MNRLCIDDKSFAHTATFRSISTREECAAVIALEREIWGPNYDDAVPLALLLVTATRGSILIGAFDDHDQMIGFVYSLQTVKNGVPMQWSYKLGVAPAHRNEGLGRRLKLLQRERALEMGIDLIEWTFDPMLAPNAYLNLSKLGAVAYEYAEDLYGQTLAPVLHRKIPTDRLLVSWQLQARNVENRRSPVVVPEESRLMCTALEKGVPANCTAQRGEWLECSGIALDIEAPLLMVEIPLDYSKMVTCAPEAAMDWRLSIRQILKTYLGRGYGAVEFVADPSNGRGAYLLIPMSELSQSIPLFPEHSSQTEIGRRSISVGPR
ncbi:MAG TPA: hypothetical protein VGK24_18750 [Candidatus Angelobacter sp.]